MSAIPPDLGADGPAAAVRLTFEARHRGNVVARTVAAHPLEHMLESGQLTVSQYDAARRVRRALSGSWFQPRVTTRWASWSDASEYDEEGEPLSEDAQWAAMASANATWREAERLCGPSAWPWVRGVCEGYWPGSRFRYDLLRAGLSALVSEWRLTR